MAKTSFKRAILALTAFFMAGGIAAAQSPECQRYRAELASLGTGGGIDPALAAQAQAQRAEISRLMAYHRSIGCERGPLGFLSGPAPAECGPISQQIRQMEANYSRLVAQARESDGGVEMRRRQLQAAVQQACAVDQPRGFFETLFGAPRQQQQAAPEMLEEAPPQDRPLGGRRLVCVKTCDGSFFPLSNAPTGREGATEMCQALCPGTETVAFATSGGEESLGYAVSIKGQPYTSLANAFKFRKTFDESCACKREGENWAVVLRKAESMLDKSRGDMIVSAEKAEELSRPKAAAPAKGKAADKKASDAAEAQAAEAAAAAPTASSESSGIGPQSIEGDRVIGQSEGQKREVVTDTGAKRTVRMVAPNIIPVPETKKP
ncbi:DUF2865 domain-containing protein [Microvirga flavescens]|uniref:DUF2865 domain-containing protein n=1 Tax=Microvirga flavescens TaxID=2249811 RepID=UPI0013005F5A|nr:DUF2865 domain-containing protein [Microvirga flavescens]